MQERKNIYTDRMTILQGFGFGFQHGKLHVGVDGTGATGSALTQWGLQLTVQCGHCGELL